MDFRLILSLLFAIIIALFALTNGDKVTINLFFTKLQMSQAIVILISTTLGALIVFFITLIQRIKMGLTIKSLEKEKIKLIQQIENLSNESKTTISNEVSEVNEDVK
jgi:uncharacterized integral membrane protein